MANNSVNSAPQSSKNIYFTVAVILVFITIIVATFFYRLGLPRILNEVQLRENGVFLFENPRSFKEFSLVDYNNNAFSSENFQGKWSLVFFGFTFCPDICPTSMVLLSRFYQQQLEQDFGDDLQIILVTVDPARDTPEVLFDYVRHFNESFIGLTGEFLDIHRFATQLNIPFSKVPGGGENYTVDHSGNVVIINSHGHYVGFIKSPLDVAKLNTSYQSIRLSADY
jgi:protein SCO1/2